MDPENPATEVEQLRPYARMCSILEHIHKMSVLRVDGSKSCCTLYLYNIQMQIVIKKSQDVFFRFLKPSGQKTDSDAWLGRVHKKTS